MSDRGDCRTARLHGVCKPPPSLIDPLIDSSFSSKYSTHHNSQTLRASDLKFVHNIYHLSLFMCKCNMSRFTCHMSHVIFSFIFFSSFFLLNGGASRWRVCYQRVLPHIVVEQLGYTRSGNRWYVYISIFWKIYLYTFLLWTFDTWKVTSDISHMTHDEYCVKISSPKL